MDMALIQHTPQIALPSLRYTMGEKINQLSFNNYSTFVYVKKLQEEFSYSLFSRLRSTFLGPIIKAALQPLGGAMKTVEGLGFSAATIHFLLSRMILTKAKDELWCHFGGQPMRFSLREFHLVTGLPCWESEEEDNCIGHFIDTNQPRPHNCDTLLSWIRGLPENAEEGKLRLGMLLIMESVFFVKYSSGRCTFGNEYLNLAKDQMMTYAWGKKGFKLLMDSIADQVSTKKNAKYEVKGFPMALQLWLLASVPKLEKEFALLDNNNQLERFICARYSRTSQCTYEQLEAIETYVESSEEEEVSCILRSLFDEDAELSIHEDGDELGKVVTLVKRGYRVTASDWDRKFIDLETAGEYISQKTMRFHFQEDVSEEIHEENDVRDDRNVSNKLEEELLSLRCHVSELEEEKNTLRCRVSELEEEVLSLRFQNAVKTHGDDMADVDEHEEEESEDHGVMHSSGNHDTISDPSAGVMLGDMADVDEHEEEESEDHGVMHPSGNHDTISDPTAGVMAGDLADVDEHEEEESKDHGVMHPSGNHDTISDPTAGVMDGDMADVDEHEEEESEDHGVMHPSGNHDTISDPTTDVMAGDMADVDEHEEEESEDHGVMHPSGNHDTISDPTTGVMDGDMADVDEHEEEESEDHGVMHPSGNHDTISDPTADVMAGDMADVDEHEKEESEDHGVMHPSRNHDTISDPTAGVMAGAFQTKSGRIPIKPAKLSLSGRKKKNTKKSRKK